MNIFSLLAVKVFVGINLLGFAYRRYASMTTRDTVETEKDKEVKEMNKNEEASMTRSPWLYSFVNHVSFLHISDLSEGITILSQRSS